MVPDPDAPLIDLLSVHAGKPCDVVEANASEGELAGVSMLIARSDDKLPIVQFNASGRRHRECPGAATAHPSRPPPAGAVPFFNRRAMRSRTRVKQHETTGTPSRPQNRPTTQVPVVPGTCATVRQIADQR